MRTVKMLNSWKDALSFRRGTEDTDVENSSTSKSLKA
jgi:hypothetical protein